MLEEIEISVLLSLTRDLFSKIAPLMSVCIENVEVICLQFVKKQNWGQIFKNMEVFSPYVKISQMLCAQWPNRVGRNHFVLPWAALQSYKLKTC